MARVATSVISRNEHMAIGTYEVYLAKICYSRRARELSSVVPISEPGTWNHTTGGLLGAGAACTC